jgi:hypothetical protein
MSRLRHERVRLLLIGLTALAALLLLAALDGGQGESGRDAGADGRRGEWQALPAAQGARQAGLSDLEAVRAGDRVLIVAGASHEQDRMSGLEYSVGRGRWGALAKVPLHWRVDYSLVGAGGEAILWGGTTNTGSLGDGALYAVGERRWRRTAPAPLRPRASHTAVWTGSRMLVWGGAADGGGRRRWGGNVGTDGPSTLLGDGASYDPATDRWRMLAPAPLDERQGHVAVWAGSRMLVWGGETIDQPGFTAGGAAYDPASDSWKRIRRAPIRSSPDAQAFWTGEAMLVWSGRDLLAYFPLGDYWTVLPRPPLQMRMGATAAWDGAELILWGGTVGPCGDCYRHRPSTKSSDGAAYDPRTGRWRLLPTSPLPPRDRHVAVPVDEGGVLVWGGCCSGSRQRADGGLYAGGRAATPGGPGPKVATACRQAGEENDVDVLCPTWLPGSRTYDGAPAYAVEHEDFAGDRCSQLTELINLRQGAGGPHPFHVWIGARCEPFPLRGLRGHWPPSPNTQDYLALVGEAPELLGREREGQLVSPRIVGSARVSGSPALVLAVEPFPGGGLHGGHYAVVWNEGSAGYALSFHYSRGDEAEPPSESHVRALVRAAESMRRP